MKILALEKELSHAASERSRLREETARVWELQQSGVLREIYFRADQHTAILVLECASVDEARQVLASLPLVRAGHITFDLVPLVPYDGFARLFADAG